MLKKRSACSRFVQAWVQPRLPRVSTVPCQAIIEVAVGGQGDQGAGSPLDHRQVALAEVESQPGSTSICARSRPSFECRPLPAITLADQRRWGGGNRQAAGEGKCASSVLTVLTEVVSPPVVLVLSYLPGLQGRLDLRGSSCPSSRPTASGDGLICPKDVFASTASAQQRRHNFLPLSAEPPFLAKQESSSCAVWPP